MTKITADDCLTYLTGCECAEMTVEEIYADWNMHTKHPVRTLDEADQVMDMIRRFKQIPIMPGALLKACVEAAI